MHYDLVIAGCGTAGAAAALTAAKNMNVCVIERKETSEVGKKICGDAIHSDHLKFVKQLGIDLSEKELLNKITKMHLIAPNKTDYICVEDEGWVLDRHAFGQKLFKEVARNAKILKAEAIAPIIKENKVIGMKTNKEDIFGDVVIDASGVAGTLRRQITFDTDFPKEMGPNDLAKAYRGIVEVNEPFDAPDTIKIEFNNSIAPGGYLWYFPKSQYLLNIGIGYKSSKSAKELYDEYVANQFNIKRVIDESAWVLPMRRPFNGFVANGFMIIGDVASHVNPLDGAGIGYSIRGGILAAEAAKNGSSKEELWQYNYNFQTEIGVKHAQFAILASAIASLSNDELNFVFGSGLINAEDIKRSYTGKSSMTSLNMVKKLMSGITKPLVVSRLYKAMKLAKITKEHWMSYPSTPSVSEWSEKSERIFKEVNKIFPAR